MEQPVKTMKEPADKAPVDVSASEFWVLGCGCWVACRVYLKAESP